jgi:hypothetical protein
LYVSRFDEYDHRDEPGFFTYTAHGRPFVPTESAPERMNGVASRTLFGVAVMLIVVAAGALAAKFAVTLRLAVTFESVRGFAVLPSDQFTKW